MISRIATADGLSLVGEARGPDDGPLVILLHGGGQTRHSWDETLGQLAAAGYRAFAYDARGHGESDWSPTGRYDGPAFADDLAIVAAELGRPAALIGASLGGLAAMAALARAPSPPFWALALVDVVPRMNEAGRDRVRAFMAAHPDGFASVDEVLAAVADYAPQRDRPPARAGIAKNLRRRGDRYYWHWDPAFLDHRQYDLGAVAIEDVLQRSAIPLMLVRGGRSDVVTDAEARSFSLAVPRAEVVEVAGAAHMVAGDDNDAFGRTILDFLARARTAAVL